MKFKGLTFGTLFLFLSMSLFSQTQKPTTPAAKPAPPPQKTTAPAQQPQRVAPPAGSTAPQPQRVASPATHQRPATDAAREADARRVEDAARMADGEEMPELHLMPPERGGGRPLMEVLNDRKSTRRFAPRELDPHIMSGLLWAANGVNRDVTDEAVAAGTATTAGGKRTAPSARDAREIDIYIVTERGIYLYIPDGHVAKGIRNGDFRREILGKSTFAHEAPVVLVYVANSKKMEKFDLASKDIYAAVDCGFISQNVYLYCASEQLATVILGNFSKEAATRVLGLRNDKPMFAQPVGHWD